jgi:UDP-N-acetylmuramyl pentapeptide phosphotransferase/UDP-N-acetylglucosamine-1-phosphate transferase
MSLSDFSVIAGVSFAVSLFLVLTRHWHGRFSMDHTEGVQKFHTEPTPRIGGVAIFAAMVVGWLTAADQVKELIAPLLLASLPAFAFGMLEDVTKRVGVLARLLATFGSGVVACLVTGITLDRAGVPLLDDLFVFWPFAVFFTAFAVSGVANAVNIIDGFNGLSSGAVMIILASLGAIAKFHGDTALVGNCLVLGSAVFGFWLVNFPLGKLFLGDGGAYLVGFALGWLAVLLVARNPGVSPWLVLLACGYPVIEVLYSMWRRVVNNRSTGAPDRMHMHSVIKQEVVMPRLVHWSATMRNSAVAPIMWLFAAIPAAAAVLLVEAPLWMLVSANALAIVLYHLLYQQIRSKPDES